VSVFWVTNAVSAMTVRIEATIFNPPNGVLSGAMNGGEASLFANRFNLSINIWTSAGCKARCSFVTNNDVNTKAWPYSTVTNRPIKKHTA
jgi:hypothetical protein